MRKQHIITISGKLGSRKSSTADSTAELFDYTRHSCGDLVRKFITEHKMTLAKYNVKARHDHGLDEKLASVWWYTLSTSAAISRASRGEALPPLPLHAR